MGLALPVAIRHILGAQMIEGCEVRAAGEEQGRAQGLRDAVLALARIKLEVVAERDVAAIEAMHDQRVLNDLIVGLGRAATSVEAREVLAGVPGYSNSRP